MKITEDFIKEILAEDYPSEYQSIYDQSLLLQYLDKKMKAEIVTPEEALQIFTLSIRFSIFISLIFIISLMRIDSLADMIICVCLIIIGDCTVVVSCKTMR